MKQSAIIDANFVEVDQLLKKLFDKQLFYPSETDKAKLLKLRLWSERYHVSMEYILGKLIPYFNSIAKRYSRKVASRGLGTRIANFTGQAAEAHLIKCIEKDYPDGEQRIEWKEKEKQQILSKLLDEADSEVPKKKAVKTILKYKTISSYTDAYEQKINKMRKSIEKVEKEVSCQPFRGNPFR